MMFGSKMDVENYGYKWQNERKHEWKDRKNENEMKLLEDGFIVKWIRSL